MRYCVRYSNRADYHQSIEERFVMLRKLKPSNMIYSKSVNFSDADIELVKQVAQRGLSASLETHVSMDKVENLLNVGSGNIAHWTRIALQHAAETYGGKTNE